MFQADKKFSVLILCISTLIKLQIYSIYAIVRLRRYFNVASVSRIISICHWMILVLNG